MSLLDCAILNTWLEKCQASTDVIPNSDIEIFSTYTDVDRPSVI
jgi:hypothetical protein